MPAGDTAAAGELPSRHGEKQSPGKTRAFGWVFLASRPAWLCCRWHSWSSDHQGPACCGRGSTQHRAQPLLCSLVAFLHILCTESAPTLTTSLKKQKCLKWMLWRPGEAALCSPSRCSVPGTGPSAPPGALPVPVLMSRTPINSSAGICVLHIASAVPKQAAGLSSPPAVPACTSAAPCCPGGTERFASACGSFPTQVQHGTGSCFLLLPGCALVLSAAGCRGRRDLSEKGCLPQCGARRLSHGQCEDPLLSSAPGDPQALLNWLKILTGGWTRALKAPGRGATSCCAAVR